MYKKIFSYLIMFFLVNTNLSFANNDLETRSSKKKYRRNLNEASYETLPLEIKVRINETLTGRDVGVAAQVSKSWNSYMRKIDGNKNLIIDENGNHPYSAHYLLEKKIYKNGMIAQKKYHEELRNIQIDLFFDAIESGNLDEVKLLFNKNDFNLNEIISLDSFTPLFLASRKGHNSIVTFLLEKRANPNLEIDTGYAQGKTPLFAACEANQKKTVEILLKAGALVNLSASIGPHEGVTALGAAATYAGKELIQVLLDSGAKLNKVSRNGYSPLYLAFVQNNLEAFTFLLDSGADVNLTPHYGNPIVYELSKSDNIDMLEYIIEKGAKVDEFSHFGQDQGISAIHVASASGFDDIVELLIQSGADKNLVMQNGPFRGKTALYIASLNGNAEVVKTLLETEILLPAGETQQNLEQIELSFNAAIYNGHQEVVNIFMQNKESINIRSQSYIFKNEIPL